MQINPCHPYGCSQLAFAFRIFPPSYFGSLVVAAQDFAVLKFGWKWSKAKFFYQPGKWGSGELFRVWSECFHIIRASERTKEEY